MSVLFPSGREGGSKTTLALTSRDGKSLNQIAHTNKTSSRSGRSKRKDHVDPFKNGST